MALYRENSTGFVQEHASNPGAGYTLISAQPTDTVTNRVNWWRDVDKGSFDSAWHPSLQTSTTETPGDDSGAGRGINILPNDYASFEWPGGLPPTHTTNATISQGTNHLHGNACARVTLTSAGGVAWLAPSGNYNIVFAANRKWIMSWYVKPTTAVARTASIKLETANGTYTVSATTDGSTAWQRLSGVFDLTDDAATEAHIGLSLDTTSVALDFDALMLEEQIGRESTPSPFYSPWGFGINEPEQFPDYGIPTLKLYQDLQDRIDLIDGDELLDGSVNARLASQYDTLVQQVNQLAVGNGQFDSKQIWYFDTSADITGWTNGGCTLAVSGGYLTVTGTGATPFFRTSTLAIDGAAYQLIRMRVKRTAGTGWTGTLTYYYGASSSGTKTISEPTSIDSDYVEVDWDMSAEAGYTGNTITGIRLQLGTGSGDTFSLDWMGVGRNAPGASYSQLEAVRVLSDNKTRVFYQNAAPSSDANYTLKANDLWFDTDDGNKPYRWTGSAWAETTDTRLADSWSEILDIRNVTANPSGAAAQRINAISAASVKTRTYYQTNAPTTGMVTGDLWFDTDDGNKPYRYSGTAWVETTDTRITTLQASVANKEEAKVGYCSINPGTNTTRALCLAAGGTWTDQPFATAVKQVSVTNANGTASVETNLSTLATDTGALKTQYSVKLDVSGYVAGFGLYNDGAGASGFLINADKFAIGKPGATTLIPFYVDTGTNTTFINNASIKNGSITSALIGDAQITTAKIGDAQITTAKIASLTADKITGGTIGAQTLIMNGVSSVLRSSNYSTSAGWQILGDGTAVFNNVTVNGTLKATTTFAGTWTAANIPNLSADKITAGTLNASLVNVTNLNAGSITTGTLNGTNVTVTNLNATNITTGTLNGVRVGSGIAGGNLNDLSITAAKIADATITNAKIANATITDAKITGTLSADRIAAGSITTGKLNFTPVQSTNVVASINATAEGIRIAGNRITIDGNVTFASGYNPTGKIASGGAANDVNNNTTEINGGKITTGTLNANRIVAGTITADRISIGGVTTDRIDSGAVTASGGYGASSTAVCSVNTPITFWTPNQTAVSYGRGSIAFLSSLQFRCTGIPSSTTTVIPYRIDIFRNGSSVRSITSLSPSVGFNSTFTALIQYFDTTKDSAATTYTFQFTNLSAFGYAITCIFIDEYWVEYKR
jgi:hypothetical protein